MISHRYKLIFIHQRKAAGISIITSFGLMPSQKDWHVFNDGALSTDPLWSDRESVYGGYVVAACIRNPWDRFISGWKYLNSTKKKPIMSVLNNLPKSGHDYRHLTRPQSSTLFDA